MPWKKMGDFEVNLHYVGPVSLNNSKGIEINYVYQYNFKIKHKDLGLMSWTILLDHNKVEKGQIATGMMKAVFKVLDGFLEVVDKTSANSPLQNLEDVLKNISKELEEG